MTIKVDEKDEKILELLKNHAEYTTREIAKKTLLPVTTVHNRIKKLRDDGIIRKYTVRLDHSKLGNNFVAYVLVSTNLELLKRKNKTQYDLINDIRKSYFVERADIVTGGTDMVVIVRVNDVQEFDECLVKRLQMIEGINSTQSLIVIHSR
ncbi:MAG: Lrp/AsnC family transcriptional regulator [Candidatus Woesearchaeota archaeon]